MIFKNFYFLYCIFWKRVVDSSITSFHKVFSIDIEFIDGIPLIKDRTIVVDFNPWNFFHYICQGSVVFAVERFKIVRDGVSSCGDHFGFQLYFFDFCCFRLHFEIQGLIAVADLFCKRFLVKGLHFEIYIGFCRSKSHFIFSFGIRNSVGQNSIFSRFFYRHTGTWYCHPVIISDLS